MGLKILILGGTTGGRLLAEELAREGHHSPLLSFAGRTASLKIPDVPHRVGGFGGPEGLAAHLRTEGYDVLIDATHAFAARISHNAVQAAALTDTPLLRLEEPAWRAGAGDRWTSAASMEEAARALGEAAQRVFLAVGRLEIAAFHAAPQHDYLVRAVDRFEPGLPRARVIAARGPFTLEGELALFRGEAVQVVVSKNAGTPSTQAKLEAARMLGLPVIMVERPVLPAAQCVATVAEARAWLARAHGASRTKRGV